MSQNCMGHTRIAVVLLVLLTGHSHVLAQETQPEPPNQSVPDSAASRAPEARGRSPELQPPRSRKPSLAAPLLLTFFAPAIGVAALGIGAENRTICTDGCDNEIAAPYLVTAAVAAGATVVGLVWLISRLIARSSNDDEVEREQLQRRRYRLAVQLSPGRAGLDLRFQF